MSETSDHQGPAVPPPSHQPAEPPGQGWIVPGGQGPGWQGQVTGRQWPPQGPAPATLGPVPAAFGPMWPMPQLVVRLHDGVPVSAASVVEPVPGTDFCVAYPRVSATQSGLSIGSLAVGIASLLVALVVGCVGAGTSAGVAVAGAFAVLGCVTGCGAIGLGLAGLRQVRRNAGQVTGRGLGLAGLACGGSGLLLTVLAILVAALIAAGR